MDKKLLIGGVVVFGVVAVAIFAGSGGESAVPAPSGVGSGASVVESLGESPAAGNGLQVTDIIAGTGETAFLGATVVVHYIGKLENGQQFDSSYDRGEPFRFTLGGGQVIPGFEQGIEDMKVGGKRQIVIPPALGYGSKGVGSVIPPNSTLVFEVDLLSVESTPPALQ